MPSFADDMTLYGSHTSASLACSTVSAALKDTSRAFALRGLSTNVSKTVAMVTAPNSRACQGLPTGVRLLLQNEQVKLVSQTRLLGIIFDYRRSLSRHVDSVCKKFGRKIGVLRLTYRQLTPRARRQYFPLSVYARFGVCCNHPIHADKIDFWRPGGGPFDAWQVFRLKMMSYR